MGSLYKYGYSAYYLIKIGWVTATILIKNNTPLKIENNNNINKQQQKTKKTKQKTNNSNNNKK
jgi:hypothetical protein